MSLNLCPADYSVCPSSHWSSDTKDVLIRLQPSLFRRPPISLFLPFHVFFLHPDHHYLDKLLTLPEKLNYINNSTMKILSSSETSTAANKNLPAFHQATWVWIKAIHDCVVRLCRNPPSTSPGFLYMDKYVSFQKSSQRFLESRDLPLKH